MTTAPTSPLMSGFTAALPFWLSLILIPLAVITAMFGGWALVLLPVSTWYLFSILDYFTGLNEENIDPQTPDQQLYWYKLITLIWTPVQLITIFGLMAYVINSGHLASHFRSEHLLVHHRYVATPKDPVTARFNEHFWRFFPRVLRECYASAFHAEKAMLARKKRVFQLELVNYVEHYGLTRKHLGDGKYEHVLPRHSWNAAQKASNWLLINLQRHSDHHYKPDRRFPLLQTYDDNDAPQLPYGYPLMTMIALSPRMWRNMMNPRVQAWREKSYPEITDWLPYKQGTNPLPR